LRKRYVPQEPIWRSVVHVKGVDDVDDVALLAAEWVFHGAHTPSATTTLMTPAIDPVHVAIMTAL
jgi:hypothetical protein